MATALRRRVPHIPVVLARASVQGPQAAGELVEALERMYRLAGQGLVDVILLVRGGGSIEDLWPFNEELLARAIVRSPVPLVCGVGHETDVTIADFCADLRAPTPTAAAELVARPRAELLQELSAVRERLVAETGDHPLEHATDFVVGLADEYSCHGSMIDRARWISGGRMV